MNNLILIKSEKKIIRITSYIDVEKILNSGNEIVYGKLLVDSILEIDDINLYNSINSFLTTTESIYLFMKKISELPSKHTYITFFMMLYKKQIKVDYEDIIYNCVINNNIDLFCILERECHEDIKHYYQKSVNLCGRYNSVDILSYLSKKILFNYKECLRNICEKGNVECFEIISNCNINIYANNYELFDYTIKSKSKVLLEIMLKKISKNDIDDNIINRWIKITDINCLTVILNFIETNTYNIKEDIYKQFIKKDELEIIRLVSNIDKNKLNILCVLRCGYCMELNGNVIKKLKNANK